MNESALNKLDRTYFKQLMKDPTGYVCGNIPVRLLADLAKENETLRKYIKELEAAQ